MSKGKTFLKTITLKGLFGEFCTDRHHQNLSALKLEIENALAAEKNIIIDRAGIKILSVSFIDELLSELAVKYTCQKIKALVQFDPPLESVYEDQIDRGVRLRSKK